MYSPALTDFTFMVKVRTLSLYSLHVERELPADRVTCRQSCLWIDCVSVFCRKCSMCYVAILWTVLKQLFVSSHFFNA